MELEYQILDKLDLLVAAMQEARDPIDFPIQISTTMPWNVDYHDRKHLFIWSPVNITLSLEDYGTLTVNASNWQQLDMPAGMRVLSTTNTAPIYIYGKATDEYEVDEAGTLTTTISNTLTTPAFIIAPVQGAIENGNGYVVTTGPVTGPGASAQLAFSLFNPSGSGRNVHLYRIDVESSTASSGNMLRSVAVDPGYTNVVTPRNSRIGGSGTSNMSATYVNAATGTLGTLLQTYQLQTLPVEVMSQGQFYEILPGNGIINFIQVGTTATWNSNYYWYEV